MSKDVKHEHEHEHEHEECTHEESHKEEVGHRHSYQSTVWGLCFHSIFDGVAIGAAMLSKNPRALWVIFFAIALHKSAAAFGLGAYFKKLELTMCECELWVTRLMCSYQVHSHFRRNYASCYVHHGDALLVERGAERRFPARLLRLLRWYLPLRVYHSHRARDWLEPEGLALACDARRYPHPLFLLYRRRQCAVIVFVVSQQTRRDSPFKKLSSAGLGEFAHSPSYNRENRIRRFRKHITAKNP